MLLPARRLRRALLVALPLLMSAGNSQAQGWTGLAMSNHGGTNGLYVNPASLADSPFRLYVNLGAADWSLYNNFLELRGPYSVWELVRGQVPAGALNTRPGGFFSETSLLTRFDGRPKHANLAAEVRLPAVTFTRGSYSFAFSNRVRAFLQVNNVPEGFARLGRYGAAGLDSAQLVRLLVDSKQFSLNANAWHEFAFSTARAFTPNTRHFFKGGVTMKYLVGLGVGYINARQRSSSGQLRDAAGESPAEGAGVAPVDIRYLYTDAAYYQQKGLGLRDFYNGNRLGQGVGLDLGITYEFRPSPESFTYEMDGGRHFDRGAAKYRWRVGLALTDLGSIRYQKPRVIRGQLLRPTLAPNVSNLDTIGWHGFPYIDALTSRVFGVKEAIYHVNARLPASLNLSVDRRLRENFYVGLLWQQSLQSRYEVGVRTFSSLTVAPRFEHQQTEFAIPLRLGNDYRTLRPGFMLRIGPAFFGTDDLAGWMGDREMRGFNLYFGAAFVLTHHRPRDRDEDLVSDRHDRCPDLPGDGRSSGCPGGE